MGYKQLCVVSHNLLVDAPLCNYANQRNTTTYYIVSHPNTVIKWLIKCPLIVLCPKYIMHPILNSFLCILVVKAGYTSHTPHLASIYIPICTLKQLILTLYQP